MGKSAAVFAILLAGVAASADDAGFRDHVAPLLVRNCLECHNASLRKGGLSLATRPEALKGGEGGAAIVPGKPDQSLLMKMILPQAGGDPPEMPKKKTPLSAGDAGRIRAWISSGAPWPDDVVLRAKSVADKNWWSLRPLAEPPPPAPEGLPPSWSHPIDRFIFAGLVARGLKPSTPADPRDFIRRATYDLNGLPPAPGEVEGFVREYAQRPDAAVQALVDRLLASPRYGERWGRHWLDVVRFGESTGFERNIIHDDAWPFRDYVIRSLNEDKPFDRFITEHLAGDQLAPGDPEVEVGTGFLVAGPYDNVGNQDAKAKARIRADTLDDVVTATGSAFLGLTLHCARCHDHKFDPILQSDYYRVQAAFAGVDQGSRELASKEDREAREARRAGLVAGIAEAQAEELKAKKAALEKQLKALPKLPTAWIGKFRTPDRTFVALGGDPGRRGPDVAPASPAVIDPCAKGYELSADAPEGSRRLSLAQWIVAGDNPLTRRALANRVWHYHFGTGIVDSPGDLGVMGGRPTHPELLDWLAVRLGHHGWRLKPLHREIMLTQAYRQSATWRKEGAAADRDARLLWRFPPRRLSAEEVRDTMLSVSGSLDLKMGGPGFRLYRYVNDNVSTYIPLDKVGPETYRRAVYHQNARASTVDLLSEFDLPDCAFATPRRSSTTTPLQALTLLNHPFTMDMAERLARRIRAEAPDAQVRRAYVLAFGRPPSSEEESEAAAFVSARGLTAFCRAALNCNEMLYVY